MTDSLRAFVAIDLPDTIRRQLEQLQRRLKKDGLNLRWVAPAGIHLTLRFLGDIPADDVPLFAKVLELAAADCADFQLKAKGLGVFPGIRRARVLWCGLGGDLDTLRLLEKRLSGALFETAGVEPERRPFKGHLTLGRMRGAVDPRRLADALAQSGGFETEPFEVSRLTLFRSRLTPRGAIYTPLAEVDFVKK